MNDKLVIKIICIWVVVCWSVQGSDIDCTVDCACCVDRNCGPGNYFINECTLGCIDGYAGARCYVKCPNKCKTCTAESGSETCTVCHEGYYDLASKCTSECLPNCKTCTSCSTCTSCKDEYYNDNGSNDCRYRKCPINCKCENDQCTSCIQGYYDTRKSCISSCPGNCVSCSSATLCDTCKDGYYNGYQYDDSSLPLKNDCSYNCRDNCVNCSSYDLCLVCKAGHYGPGCEGKCSVGCTSAICDKETGHCNCVPYFAGNKCDRCQQGKYGDMCDINCSIGCNDNVCEKKSGYCTNGCIVDTIIGDKCDVCQTGWYGTYCNLSCSVGCKTKQCKRTNGECTEGCVDNIIGKQCDKCIAGKYGQTCDRDCPNNCVDKRCVRESATESSDPVNIAIVVLGTFLALSLVGNIILVAICIHRKYRQRKSTRGPIYENTETELNCKSVPNLKESSSTAQVSNSNITASPREYEDLRGNQVTEHEYGEIRTPA